VKQDPLDRKENKGQLVGLATLDRKAFRVKQDPQAGLDLQETQDHKVFKA
jgi:hypothetical protein